MKTLNSIIRKRTSASGLLLIVLLAGNALQIFAHGGEDHGDEKPKTETTDKGIVSYSKRLDDLEVMIKSPVFVPDTATTGRLFVTKFETNQGIAEVTPAIEIESSKGSVTEAKVEKTDTVGVFNVSFPALPTGTYIIRSKLSTGGKTNTATFSGVEVAPKPTISADGGGMSWARSILIGFVFLTVLGLFGGLTYFVLRFSKGNPIAEKTVSA